jgi:hypothetical protein
MGWMGGMGTSNGSLSGWADDRYASDESDPVSGMPNISGWVSELDKRLENGDLKGGKKDMEKQ